MIIQKRLIKNLMLGLCGLLMQGICTGTKAVPSSGPAGVHHSAGVDRSPGPHHPGGGRHSARVQPHHAAHQRQPISIHATTTGSFVEALSGGGSGSSGSSGNGNSSGGSGKNSNSSSSQDVLTLFGDVGGVKHLDSSDAQDNS